LVLSRKLPAEVAGGLRFLLLGARLDIEEIHKKQLRSS
jgi:hypothetical protein